MDPLLMDPYSSTPAPPAAHQSAHQSQSYSAGATAVHANAYGATAAAAGRYSPLMMGGGGAQSAAVNGTAAAVGVTAAGGFGQTDSPSLLARNEDVLARERSSQQIQHPLELFTDFTRPDGQRTRPLLVDAKRLYVDEHYISVWSPVLRSWCIECPDRELILANVQYDHVLEMLLAIHPTYKEVDEQTVHILLPLAFDYQMDGLLHRCECFLVANKLPFLEKVWLADRFQLNRLLALLLRELRPNAHKLDLSGPRYAGLSDRVKVLLLERMHGSPAPEELPEPPVDMEHLLSANNLNFATVRAKTGLAYHVNPYYVAAWSALFQERLCNGMGGAMGPNDDDMIYCPCSSEELKYFLMAIYPPQLRITESNIAPVLMAACKLESHGLLRKCATILLSAHTQLSVFVRLSLLDRCRLQELLDQCLLMVQRPEHLVEMSQQQTYECLSVRAKAAMMDRFAQLVQQQGGGASWLLTIQSTSAQPTPLPSTAMVHMCARCKAQSGCVEVTWQCPQCKTYTSPPALEERVRVPHQHQNPQQQQQPTERQRQSAQQHMGAAGGGSRAVSGSGHR